MKTFAIYTFLIISFFQQIQAQDIPTVGEIYDYDIGDIFHYFREEPGVCLPFKLTRKEVISKAYSVEMDTVFYTFYRERLSTQPVEPFETFMIDTVSYLFTNLLDSIITNLEEDTTVCIQLIEDEWCNFSTIYHSRTVNCEMLGSSTRYNNYGIGLGEIVYGTVNSEYNYRSEELIFVAKGKSLDQRCGTPDNRVTARIGDIPILETNIYPNPTPDYIQVQSETNFDKIICFNSSGSQIEVEINFNNMINVQDLDQGQYYLVFIKDNAFISKAFIKK